jgi:cytochrome o ubiquinol oxidase operon protein cyoD
MNQEDHRQNIYTFNPTFRKYLVGIILAFILTLVSFALVKIEVSKISATIGLFLAAILQILVHLHYFLHLDRSSSARWNVIVFAFTILLLAIFIGGTIWIIYSLNSRMM